MKSTMTTVATQIHITNNTNSTIPTIKVIWRILNTQHQRRQNNISGKIGNNPDQSRFNTLNEKLSIIGTKSIYFNHPENLMNVQNIKFYRGSKFEELAEMNLSVKDPFTSPNSVCISKYPKILISILIMVL